MGKHIVSVITIAHFLQLFRFCSDFIEYLSNGNSLACLREGDYCNSNSDLGLSYVVMMTSAAMFVSRQLFWLANYQLLW